MLNRKDWIRYNHNILDDNKPNNADKKLDDVFSKYQQDRIGELATRMQSSLYKASATDDINKLATSTFNLCSMVAVNESAILRLWAILIDPKSTKDDLKDSFEVFITDVVGHDNKALKKFSSRLDK